MVTGNRLYDKYIELLIAVNDETKTRQEHDRLLAELRGWKQGVNDATGWQFNGDYYYIGKFESGEMQERPLCCGVFLDWESKAP